MSRLGTGFVSVLKRLSQWSGGRPRTVTVAVTERYCRRALGIRKGEPTAYRGFYLQCIGSQRWRDLRRGTAR